MDTVDVRKHWYINITMFDFSIQPMLRCSCCKFEGTYEEYASHMLHIYEAEHYVFVWVLA